MHILVTNDDGVTAPGLMALAEEMQLIGGKVSILAPDRNWSASGHVKTLDRPCEGSLLQFSEAEVLRLPDREKQPVRQLRMKGIHGSISSSIYSAKCRERFSL